MSKMKIVNDYLMHFAIVIAMCVIGIILSPWLAWKICDENFFGRKGAENV